MTRNNDPSTRAGKKVVKKRRVLRRRWKILGSFLLIAVLAVAGYATYLIMKADSAITQAYEDDGRVKSELRDEYVDPKFDNTTILLMGVDENDKRKERDVARTDALVLATLNKDEKSIKLLSIPRDSLVYIPHVGYEDKINHAHAFGGTNATIDTVENLLDIPVDYYVKLNFHAFVEVVDAIGGVEAEVPYEFMESNSNDKKDSIHLYPGKQLLDGESALALARTRKKDNDIERGKRQMELVDAIISKSTSLGSIFKYDDILEVLGKNMSTNMTFTEMKSFISYATHGGKLNIERVTLEGEDYQPNRTYYYKIDDASLEGVTNKLKAHLELPGYIEGQDIHLTGESRY